MGARLGSGSGPRKTEPVANWKRLAWLGICLLLGLPYPWVAVLNPPWTYLLLGVPLLLGAWATRPLNPGFRLLGFAAFCLGAAVASIGG